MMASPATERGRADAEAALARCDELAAISARAGRIERTFLTPEHAAANALGADWFEGAGLVPWQDAAGNVCGRREGRTPGLPALVLGSHLDAVPDAGRYDGPLGVVVALAVVDRLRGRDLPFALEVVGFADEEGARFGTALTGSKAFAGSWNPAQLDLTDADSTTMRSAFEGFGLDPDRIGESARRPEDLVGYLEVHIEQGVLLEEAGARRWASSAPSRARAASPSASWGRPGTPAAPRSRADATPSSAPATPCWTSPGSRGRRVASPRSAGCMPTRARSTSSPGRRSSASTSAPRPTPTATGSGATSTTASSRAAPGSGCGWSSRNCTARPVSPVPSRSRPRSPGGVRAVGAGEPARLLSWAGHDAMAVARVTPVGMLFVRCTDGISHHPTEHVTAEDVALAVDALEAAVLDLAGSS